METITWNLQQELFAQNLIYSQVMVSSHSSGPAKMLKSKKPTANCEATEEAALMQGKDGGKLGMLKAKWLPAVQLHDNA